MPGLDVPKVTIVVLHWKNYEQTHQALTSLRKISYQNFSVLVVDNCSANGSVEKLQQEFAECRFIVNEANLGFARGCNVGIRAAQDADPDYVLLLNNDMEVERDFLQAATSVAEADRQVGLVTGKIVFIDRPKVIWHAGGTIDRIRVQGRTRGWNELDQGQYDQVCETFWGSGAMLLIPRHTLEQVGLLPEEYFFGVEEWDYSTAVVRQGFKIIYVPEFKSYHQAGGSYKAGDPVLIVYNGLRNKLVFAQKYFSAPVWFLWRIVFRIYLSTLWPRKARWHCETDEDYRARLKAARLAFTDHRGLNRIELEDLERASRQIGPTPTWGNTWGAAASATE